MRSGSRCSRRGPLPHRSRKLPVLAAQRLQKRFAPGQLADAAVQFLALAGQDLVHPGQVPAAQVLRDHLQGHPQVLQSHDQGQPVQLQRRIEPVALFVDIGGPEQADLVVIVQCLFVHAGQFGKGRRPQILFFASFPLDCPAAGWFMIDPAYQKMLHSATGRGENPMSQETSPNRKRPAVGAGAPCAAALCGALLRFAGPIILTMVATQLYSVADTMIVGLCLDAGALAAVSNASTVLMVFLFVSGGMELGGGLLLAARRPTSTPDELSASVYNLLFIDGVLGLLMAGAGLLGAEWLLRLIRTPRRHPAPGGGIHPLLPGRPALFDGLRPVQTAGDGLRQLENAPVCRAGHLGAEHSAGPCLGGALRGGGHRGGHRPFPGGGVPVHAVVSAPHPPDRAVPPRHAGPPLPVGSVPAGGPQRHPAGQRAGGRA